MKEPAAVRPAGTPGVVITCGDPCGVGPELLVRVLGRRSLPASVVRVAAPPRLLERVALEVVAATDRRTAERFLGRLGTRFPLVPCPEPAIVRPGSWNEENVPSSLSALEAASGLALKEGAVLVTGPMDKRFFAAIGLRHGGHTEFLARFCGCPDEPLMWFDSQRVRVGLLTRHVPLSEVPALVRPERLARGVQLAEACVTRTSGSDTRPLAVAAVDPHCGEWGAIAPTDLQVRGWIDSLRARGSLVEGPFSADTLFSRRSLERYSGILCWYHDQGMIPVKLLAFEQAVNVTLGLPLARTSAAHGVAYDIAWQGLASPSSTLRALLFATQLG
ncbi:MAG: hypothetical protein FJ109_04745 [Deltaproteobacteria bacterium]|nr:hypothetical protein [Deltaproteobacteria bacterium]